LARALTGVETTRENGMRYTYVAGLFGVVAGASLMPALASEVISSTLVATNLQDSIELSVPVSKLTLVIPRGNLASVEEPRTGATAGPRYFHYVDEKRGLVLTGWFEAASSWSGFEKFWIGELRAMKNGGVSIRKAPDVVAAGPWQAAAYDVDLPKKVTSANVRAELISAGTWIDIHISVTSDLPESEERDQAVQFLRSIVVRERQ
jgi:hypothetical protein